MKSNLRFVALALAIMSIFTLTLGSAFAEEAEDTDAPRQSIYEAAAEIEDFPFDFTPYVGKALVLDFFTTWCPYCKTELPYFKQIQEEYGDEVAIVSVHVPDGETFETAQKFWEDNGLGIITLYSDDTMALSQAFGIQGYPTNVFIDKEGYLYDYQNGLTYEQIKNNIDVVLGYTDGNTNEDANEDTDEVTAE